MAIMQQRRRRSINAVGPEWARRMRAYDVVVQHSTDRVVDRWGRAYDPAGIELHVVHVPHYGWAITFHQWDRQGNGSAYRRDPILDHPIGYWPVYQAALAAGQRMYRAWADRVHGGAM